MAKKLQPMTRQEFQSLESQYPYYRERWPYFEVALKMLEGERYENVLEVGPFKRPLILGSDVMDLNPYMKGLSFQHDAAQVPWPIEDGTYDLFVATQVWEHLEGRQRDAFGEVMRCSRMALLSFPLNWNCLGNFHHGITEALVAEWTLHVPPVKKEIVGRRLILLFNFEPTLAGKLEYEVGLRHAEDHLRRLYPLYQKALRQLQEYEAQGSDVEAKLPIRRIILERIGQVVPNRLKGLGGRVKTRLTDRS